MNCDGSPRAFASGSTTCLLEIVRNRPGQAFCLSARIDREDGGGDINTEGIAAAEAWVDFYMHCNTSLFRFPDTKPRAAATAKTRGFCNAASLAPLIAVPNDPVFCADDSGIVFGIRVTTHVS